MGFVVGIHRIMELIPRFKIKLTYWEYFSVRMVTGYK
jgi:hypothetical protein